MAKKAGLTTCNGGHLGGDNPQDGIQTDVAPMMLTGQEQEEAEDITDNKDEEDANVLPVPGTIERG